MLWAHRDLVELLKVDARADALLEELAFLDLLGDVDLSLRAVLGLDDPRLHLLGAVLDHVALLAAPEIERKRLICDFSICGDFRADLLHVSGFSQSLAMWSPPHLKQPFFSPPPPPPSPPPSLGGLVHSLDMWPSSPHLKHPRPPPPPPPPLGHSRLKWPSSPHLKQPVFLSPESEAPNPPPPSASEEAPHPPPASPLEPHPSAMAVLRRIPLALGEIRSDSSLSAAEILLVLAAFSFLARSTGNELKNEKFRVGFFRAEVGKKQKKEKKGKKESKSDQPDQTGGKAA